jgi:hypothetical protein
MRLSFKKQPKETGLAGVANPNPFTDIKADKKKVGYISPPSRFGDNQWTVWLAVKRQTTDENPCPFENVRLKWRGNSEQEGRDFLKDRWESICKTYDLFQHED